MEIFWLDPNAIRRKSKIIKYYLYSQKEVSKNIERIQNKLDTTYWIEETHSEKIRLYLELGKIIEIHRINNMKINWYQKDLLKSNITG